MFLGTLKDPYTGEDVGVVAHPRGRGIPYRKRNNTFGDLRSKQSDKDWPDNDLFTLEFSNGRQFGETHYDINGWWLNTNITYMPGVKRTPVANFFIQLGGGLSNGYPLLDVLNFALRSAGGTLQPVKTAN